ncbi:rhamnosyl transferase [Thermoplasma volcanium GSS1]|uniref:Rhamnosyl transferase n=1 Tax=Thermoplasma volcanium (strain ATCC 51530 / DSM 4299 / JCM 9571 / NBRC 15438 / GSS1) TaxID=273116 RepID=Q97AC8_THEVO|nr:glycosyltransferase family 2 protein [Thermoplasma volcanium]BAB60024.1 rhamnosyl transferase [Thermoplasma volcanium GSS1]
MNNDISIAALIVTYNPDKRLIESLTKLEKLVDFVVIVDNNSNKSPVLDYISNNIFNDRYLIQLEDNLGIAYALNTGIKYILEKGHYDYILTLDQDTVPLIDDIKELIKRANSIYSNIGIIALISKMDPKIPEFTDVKFPMTSGNIVKSEIFKYIKYREEFFIDSVDFDFDYNVRMHGYRIIQYNYRAIDHNVGITKNGFPYESSERLYYIIRNSTVLFGENKITFRMYIFQAFYWITMGLIHWEILKTAKSSVKGFKDGVNKKLGKNNDI